MHTSGTAATERNNLKRELGVFGATVMGMGSILGTGVFVSIGIAAGITGPAVILAIVLAAVVATFNALNSAQLAAIHPVSGGTYEYGYKFLHPWFGFTAGWLFLCAKTASAATAALGFAGYLLHTVGLPASGRLVPVAITTIVVLTVTVISGIRMSNRVNVIVVSVTMTALAYFILSGLPSVVTAGTSNFVPFFASPSRAAPTATGGLLHASALMFVAFAGYGRIATLSEEVRNPRQTIPRAIIATLVLAAVIYISVGVVGVGAVGADFLYDATRHEAAPLEIIARQFETALGQWPVAIGAMTAMLGVLLNLILGLSRMMMAMGRRGDMPARTAVISESGQTPYVAVVVTGVLIGAITLVGDVKTTWTFSAFSILIYYAITNLAALRIPRQERLYSRFVAWGGLAVCLLLAFWVEWQIWVVGIGLIGAGLIWKVIRMRSGLSRRL